VQLHDDFTWLLSHFCTARHFMTFTSVCIASISHLIIVFLASPSVLHFDSITSISRVAVICTLENCTTWLVVKTTFRHGHESVELHWMVQDVHGWINTYNGTAARGLNNPKYMVLQLMKLLPLERIPLIRGTQNLGQSFSFCFGVHL
jgi:hypothetical protein